VNKKRGFPIAPVVVFLLTAALAFSRTVVVFGDASERRFSYFPQESVLVRVDGSRFSVENLPAHADFDYGCVEFFTPAGKSVKEEWPVRSDENSMTVDISDLPDGLYTATFYRSDELWASYTSYFSDNDVQIRVQDGEASLVTPIMYERNERFHNAGRKDIAALSAYLGPTYEIQSDDPAVRSLAAALTEGLTDDYDKALAIHDWVAGNLYYDHDEAAAGMGQRYEGKTALGALRLGRAVCEGYAKLTAALLRAAGIPAKFVYGYALGIEGNEWPSDTPEDALEPDDSNHAWNEAFIDGRWVIIDATWDSGNSYERGRKTENLGVLTHRYFDAVPEAFSANHATTDPEWELWWLPSVAPVPASPFAGGVFVDGVSAVPDAYNIGGNNYFKLRDLAAMLGDTDFTFGVGWDAASKTVSIRTDEAYAPDGTELAGGAGRVGMAVLPEMTVAIDGKAVCMEVYNIGGSNYFKLRDMAEAIGFSVDYDAAARAVLIRTEAAEDEALSPREQALP
jgi:transglutaminase-like putative cysteine protease